MRTTPLIGWRIATGAGPGGSQGFEDPLSPTKISLLVKTFALRVFRVTDTAVFWVWIQTNYTRCSLRASRFEKRTTYRPGTTLTSSTDR